MIGTMIAVLLLVGGYGIIAVLSARAVLRDELTRRRQSAGVPAPSAIGPASMTRESGLAEFSH
jgi:hypothetical protein